MTSRQSRYERDGYRVVTGRVAPDDVLGRALKGMVNVRDGEFDLAPLPDQHPGYDPRVLCKINNPHGSDSGLYGLVTCPEVGKQVAAITGSRRIQVWASQLLIKPPGSAAAGHVGWHQDRQYWKMWKEDEGLFTVWIALCDVDEQMGPMRFVKGSHRWGYLDQGDFFGKDQESLRLGIEVPEGEQWEEVSGMMACGGFSVHHCLTYHGSNANLSDRPRWSYAVHLRDERAVPVDGDESWYTSHLDDPQISPVMWEA